MALQPVSRRSVTDDVFDQLVADVLGGELAPGDALPSERRLAEVLGVSRPVVREALQRLGAAGLVEARQGDATLVRDYRSHGGVGLLPQLLAPRGELDLRVARSVLEARLAIGPAVAALAAERAGARLRGDLRRVSDERREAADPVARQRHALAYWDVIVGGADSIAFLLLFNGLRQAYEPMMAALSALMDVEVARHDAYDVLTDALTAGDPEAARAAAEALLRPATETLMAAIDELLAEETATQGAQS